MEVHKNSTAKRPAPSADARPAEGTAGSLEGQSEHVPSPELQQYAAAARQEPEVRQHRVQAVAERLRQGHYATPESARQTAAAILKSVD